MGTGSWVRTLNVSFNEHAVWIDNLFREIVAVRGSSKRTIWLGAPAFPVSAPTPSMTPSMIIPLDGMNFKNSMQFKVLAGIQQHYASIHG